MCDAYISEIRLFSFDFPPIGWAICDGALLQIAQNQALFAVIGNTYGGDGRTTFALPDLRGRVPVPPSAQLALGTRGGEERHALTTAEMPQHNHSLPSSVQTGNSNVPLGCVAAIAEAGQAYMSSSAPNARMAADCISPAGASAAHDNMQPYLCLNFCICTQGIFPVRE